MGRTSFATFALVATGDTGASTRTIAAVAKGQRAQVKVFLEGPPGAFAYLSLTDTSFTGITGARAPVSAARQIPVGTERLITLGENQSIYAIASMSSTYPTTRPDGTVYATVEMFVEDDPVLLLKQLLQGFQTQDPVSFAGQIAQVVENAPATLPGLTWRK